MGRASVLPANASFADTEQYRQYGVVVLRPLRDLLANHVAIFNRYLGLNSVFIPTLATKKGPKASIAHLTESWIAKLMSTHPGTIPTVLRSGDRLIASAAATTAHCPICDAPMFPDECSALPELTSAPSSAEPTPSSAGPTPSELHAAPSQISDTATGAAGPADGLGDLSALRTAVDAAAAEEAAAQLLASQHLSLAPLPNTLARGPHGMQVALCHSCRRDLAESKDNVVATLPAVMQPRHMGDRS
eukprot:TRINITY_DN5171_c0_g1_i2.p2 TRINITY_DN5171_c0_g1~~TRINITY_DN5171_c0_g1_i2.p2  ORF type:complete len:246 (-),score=61.41 TRINITY_DN5171_c0_g1_i2:141-878(-)